MWLTQISIKRPLLIIMAVLGLVILGLIAYTRLGADLYPSISIPYVTITTVYAGAAPADVEDRVSKPIEDAVAGVNNVKNIYSYSLDNASAVVLEFDQGTDPDAATSDVERRVKSIRSTLPDEIEEPRILKSDYSAVPVITLAITGERSSQDLYTLANEKIKPRIETVPGVAAVKVVGGREREILVKVDQSRLRGYNLSIQQVASALAQNNLSVPSGQITEGESEYTVRYTSLYQTPAQLREMPIVALSTGTIRLKDVAEVQDGLKEQSLISRFNGHESIGLLITKQSGANTVKTADGIKEKLTELAPTLPQNVSYTIAGDASVYIKSSLQSVQNTLFEAVFLTGIVLLLFLHTFRSTVIVLFSIPTSLIATFLVMWVMGFTLNMMSMLALALSIGILVDDSIVVLENIYRHLGMGKTPWTAAIDGRSEIGLAAITITLVDIVVYTPMAFMTGLVGQFFREFGITIAAATLFSLFISFTLTPMLASRWLRFVEEGKETGLLGAIGRKWDAGYRKILSVYNVALRWSLIHRWIIVTISAILFLGAVAMYPLHVLGTEFVPSQDQGEFSLTVEMPSGTSLTATSDVVSALEPKIKAIPEVKSVLTSVGATSSTFMTTSQPNQAQLSIKLVPQDQRSTSMYDVAKKIQTLVAKIPGATSRAMFPSIGDDPRSPFLAVIQGKDRDTLVKLAAQVTKIVEEIPGTTDVTNDSGKSMPELRVQSNDERLADAGLTSASVGSAVRANVEGVVASALRPEGQSKIDIRVVAADADKNNVSSLSNLPILTSRGINVSLDAVSDIKLVQSPTQIDRWNRERSATVGANVIGRPLGDVVKDFNTRTSEIDLPPGYKIELAGQTTLMNEAFVTLGTAIGLSVILIYMLLVSLYDSLVQPLIIMLSVPVSICGAFGALLLTGQNLNISSLIGIIMLIGLVTKNGILLVDYTNTLRKSGIQRTEALMEAGRTRLRPILMTSVTVIVSMVPVALKIGEGAEIRAPMAACVMGGMFTSTLLSLVLVPVVYTLLDDLQLRLARGRKDVTSEAV